MSDAQRRPAWKSPWAWAVFLLPAAIGAVADVWSKAAVFEWLLDADPKSPHPSEQIVAGVMKFTLHTNAGMAFGFRTAPYFILGATALAIGAVIFFFATSPARAKWTHAALGLIAGGALGNLYDRLGLPGPIRLPGQPAVTGQVRDFIDIGEIYYPWVFNIADVLLVVGVGILLAIWITDHFRRGKAR